MTVNPSASGFLLDTNIVSYLLDTGSPFNEPVNRSIIRIEPKVVLAISILSVYEAAVAATAMGLSANWVERFQSEFLDAKPLALPEGGAAIFARLKQGLARQRGARLRALAAHNIDLMIAATALAEDLTLVSNDSLFRTLAQIEPALRVEDWTRP